MVKGRKADSVTTEYYTSPETFESEPEDVQWWIEVGQYVFHAGCGDYYMNREGGVETS